MGLDLIAQTRDDLGSLWLPEDSRETTSKGDSTVYVCSMDPDAHQDHPGSCPRCGDVVEFPDVVLYSNDSFSVSQPSEIIGDLPGARSTDVGDEHRLELSSIGKS
jgi:hypothetical protein